MNDLLKPDGSVLEYEEFKAVYQVNATFLNYSALLRSLPAEWKTDRNRSKLEEPSIDPVISCVIAKSNGSSHLRRVLVRSKTKIVANIWEGAWEHRLGEVNWTEVYEALRTYPVQYKSNRYKIITRIAATKSLLVKMKIAQTDVCEYCTERENLEHKYWHCRRVQYFWNTLKTWLNHNRLGELAEKVNIKMVIFGGEANPVLNHVISAVIHMISTKRELSLALLIAILKSDMQSEWYQANLNKQIEDYNKKWHSLDFLRHRG